MLKIEFPVADAAQFMNASDTHSRSLHLYLTVRYLVVPGHGSSPKTRTWTSSWQTRFSWQLAAVFCKINNRNIWVKSLPARSSNAAAKNAIVYYKWKKHREKPVCRNERISGPSGGLLFAEKHNFSNQKHSYCVFDRISVSTTSPNSHILYLGARIIELKNQAF